MCTGGVLQIQNGRLTFTRQLNNQCTKISAVDNEVSDGTRSTRLFLRRNPQDSTVPSVVYPDTIPVKVIDNDGKHFS